MMSKLAIHCFVGFFIRLMLIGYGEIQDKLYVVQYTDIDYRVFTDAARHVLVGRSPYDRHTYRYTPLIAALLIPNILLHPACGKLLFSIADIVAGLLVRQLILLQKFSNNTAILCTMAWLYNPLAIVIATRGNADSISAVLVLITLLLVQRKHSAVLTGAVHALAIHVRLYPIAFSLAIYLAMQTSEFKSRPAKLRKRDIPKHSFFWYINNLKNFVLYLYPNRDQLCLVGACVGTLILLTGGCYWLYGDQFLHESLLYHLSRRDTRHNFSVYFYMAYLNSIGPVAIWQRVLIFLPQVILLVTLSLMFGTRRHLLFGTLTQSMVMVAYNPVVTSQYFVWFLSLLPSCLPLLNLSKWQSAALASLWFAAQISWLLPAYLLEFRGRETFIFIWIQGLAFFFANVAILTRLIRTYDSSRLNVNKKE